MVYKEQVIKTLCSVKPLRIANVFRASVVLRCYDGNLRDRSEKPAAMRHEWRGLVAYSPTRRVTPKNNLDLKQHQVFP